MLWTKKIFISSERLEKIKFSENRKNVTYDNIKSHKEARLHPLSRKYIFGTTEGSIWPHNISNPWFFIHFCGCKLIIFGWFQFKQIIKAVFLFVCFINTGFSLQGRLLRCVSRVYRETVVRRCTKKDVLKNNSQIP